MKLDFLEAHQKLEFFKSLKIRLLQIKVDFLTISRLSFIKDLAQKYIPYNL
jgi:hypothetical protein